MQRGGQIRDRRDYSTKLATLLASVWIVWMVLAANPWGGYRCQILPGKWCQKKSEVKPSDLFSSPLCYTTGMLNKHEPTTFHDVA